MIAATLNPSEPTILHNSAEYQLSDTSQVIDVSFPSVGRAGAVALFLYKLAHSVTEDTVRCDLSEVGSSLMSGSQRSLRLVTLRTPKAHRPHDHVPEYILIYVVETLECGHTLTVYPQSDPLIAKRRFCHECQGLLNSSSLPQKKPSTSVAVDGRRKQAV